MAHKELKYQVQNSGLETINRKKKQPTEWENIDMQTIYLSKELRGKTY